MSLSKFDVNKLKRLTIIHNVAIKSLAVENEQIYKLFFPFLTFVTNIGDLTGFQLLEAAKRFPVYYCAEVDTKSPNRKKRTIHTMYCSMRWRETGRRRKRGFCWRSRTTGTGGGKRRRLWTVCTGYCAGMFILR